MQFPSPASRFRFRSQSPIPIAIPIQDRSVINYMTTHIGFDHFGDPDRCWDPLTLFSQRLVTMRCLYHVLPLTLDCQDQCNLDIETVFNVHLLFLWQLQFELLGFG